MTQDESTPMRRIGASHAMGRVEDAGGAGEAGAAGESAQAEDGEAKPGKRESTFGPRVRVATKLDREEAFEAIVAQGPAMRGLLERVRRAAQSESPLVLEGEPGCGKRALAKLVHELSPRSDMPFVRVDCAAHDAAFIEGELFGVRRSGESRAVRDREGLVQTAHRGTLLLENLADLPAVVQPKLQEFLATGEFRPVGDRWGTRCADVRVIVNSTVRLDRHAAQGRIRRALYDRLAVLVLAVPSLRERVEDIEPLVEHFAAALRDDASDRAIEIDRDAGAWLRAYPWPGNVRELQNAVEHACTMGGGGRLRCADLPEAIRRHVQPEEDDRAVSERREGADAEPAGAEASAERERIERALRHHEGDIDRSARMLGMTRRALRYEIGRLGLESLAALSKSNTVQPSKQRARVPGERLRAALQRGSSGG